MLGRVLELEFGCYMAFDALAATITGRLLDCGIPKHMISAGVSFLAATLFMLWSIYHMFGLGAAKKQFNQPSALPPPLSKENPPPKQVAHVVFA